MGLAGRWNVLYVSGLCLCVEFCDWLTVILLDSFTGINPAQSQALTEKAHVYLTGNGRISMAGLNSHNIRYFAESLDKVVRNEL